MIRMASLLAVSCSSLVFCSAGVNRESGKNVPQVMHPLRRITASPAEQGNQKFSEFSDSGTSSGSRRVNAELPENHSVEERHLAYAPADEDLDRKDPPPPVKGPLRGLDRPQHFTYVPIMGPGVQMVLTRYLAFEDASGRKVFARMFLTEMNQKRVFYKGLDPEVAKRRRDLPQRFSAYADEIEVADPNSFTADFDIPPHFVSAMGNGVYEVNLGAVTCLVRTVLPQK